MLVHCIIMAQPDNVTCMYVGFLLGHHVNNIVSGSPLRVYTEARAMGAMVNDSYYGQCVPDEFKYATNILLQRSMPSSDIRGKTMDQSAIIHNLKNQARKMYEKLPEQFRGD